MKLRTLRRTRSSLFQPQRASPGQWSRMLSTVWVYLHFSSSKQHPTRSTAAVDAAARRGVIGRGRMKRLSDNSHKRNSSRLSDSRTQTRTFTPFNPRPLKKFQLWRTSLGTETQTCSIPSIAAEDVSPTHKKKWTHTWGSEEKQRKTLNTVVTWSWMKVSASRRWHEPLRPRALQILSFRMMGGLLEWVPCLC